MKKLLFIPANVSFPIEAKSLTLDLETMQQLVGGYLEAVDLFNPAGTMYLNEDGKLKHLPLNQRATSVIQRHKPNLVDVIVGDVFIVGPPTSGGKDSDCPAEYLKLAD